MSTAPAYFNASGMCERLQRLASSAIRTSQPNQTTMINAMNTLSQNAWPFWNGPPMRSLSNAGSRHANHSVTARPPITNSAMKIQALAQSSVPADKNSNAPIDTIQNTAFMESARVTLGLPLKQDDCGNFISSGAPPFPRTF